MIVKRGEAEKSDVGVEGGGEFTGGTYFYFFCVP